MAKKMVFIVEDDPDISELIDFVIKDAGFYTKTFLKADKVEACVIKDKPNLVIMDLYVNRVDGASLVRKFKKNKEIAKIPVVLVSAKTNLGDIAKRSNADGYLAKPFNIKDLKALVKKLT